MDIDVQDVKYTEDGKRIYIIDREEYYSVTSKLRDTVAKDEGFYRYLGNADSYEETQKNMKEAGNVGTKVHEYCEKIANKNQVSLEEEGEKVRKKVSSFIDFIDDYRPTVLDTEFVILCKEYNYAGRVDMLVEIDGERWLIDIKTSSNIYNSHKVQLMFYRYALEEHGRDVDHIAALRLDNEKYILREIEYVPRLVGAYNSIFDWTQD